MYSSHALLEKRFVLGWVLGGAMLLNASAALYPAPEYTGPSSKPALPADFAAFNPPVTNTAPVSNTPEIAEWTRSNQPGDTMALTGERLSLYSTDSEEGRDTGFVFYGEGFAPASGLIQRLAGRQCALTLPGSGLFPADEMYLLWPRNGNGIGGPVAINQTEAWWVGPDRISSGSSFCVFGRNLKLGAGECHLYIVELDRWITSSRANPYRAPFTMPADVPNGTYTVYVHNGHGGEFGWSRSLSIEVVSPVLWDGGTINVKDYGAKGDGSADDLIAIKSAIAACPARGTIYFPAGVYLLSDRISSVGSNCRLLGAGNESSIIRSHSSNVLSSSYGMIHAGLNGVEVRGLGFEAAPGYAGKLIRCRSTRNSRFVDCRFSQLENTGSADLVDVASGNNLTFKNCTFILNRNVLAATMDGFFVEDCTFLGRHDNNKLLAIDGSKQVSITGTSGRSYDDSDVTDGSGWCEGRFVNGSGNGGTHRNIYIGDCTTTNMAPRYDPALGKYGQEAGQNSGEQIMFEHLRTIYRGSVEAALSDTTIQCSGLPEGAVGRMIVVVDGTGLGQCRLVSSADVASGRITVSEPWNVRPAADSIVMIGKYASRFAIFGNHLNGHPRTTDPTEILYGSGPNYTNYTASAGVSFYGAFFESVVAGNTISDVKGAILNWSLSEQTDGMAYNVIQPNYFNFFEGNHIDHCLIGLADHHVAFADRIPLNKDPSILASVWRRNELTGITGYAINPSSNNDMAPVDLVVFDRNRCQSDLYTFSALDNLVHLVCCNNEFTGSGTGISFSPGNEPALRENTWNGFSQDYGTIPNSVLELPRRVLSLTPESATGEVDVYNAGTALLRLTAVPESGSWVEVSQVSDKVADETATGTLSVAVKAGYTPQLGDSAVITVTSDAGDAKQMTVVYESSAVVSPPPPDSPPAPVLSSIAIAGPSTVDEGNAAQYTCTATYSDGSTATVVPTWSLNSSYATISSSGLLSAGDVDANQSVTVTANFGGQTDTHTVTINYVVPVITGISISGPTSCDEETTAQYTCTASYSDGSSSVVAPTWSDNSSYVSINGNGLLTAGNVTSDKSVTITASFGGMTDTHTVTISYVAPVVTGITIAGPTSCDEETTAQYICTASYSDGSSSVVAPTWSENSSYASINGNGLLTAGNVTSDKSVTITANFDGKTDTHTVTINYVAPTLTGITISGPSSVDEETTAQYRCTANWSDGTSTLVTPSWTENSGYASISSSGLLSAGNVDSDQSVTIAASYSGKSDAHVVGIVYVAPPVELTSISINGPAELEENSTASFSCTAHYSDGSSATVTPIWSENTSFATINAAGALNVGNIDADAQVTVTASFGGYTDTQVLNVWMVATRVVYPISGFEGQLVRARLWDAATEQFSTLGEMVGPDELVLENMSPNRWYWVVMEEYDDASGEWVRVQANWINM